MADKNIQISLILSAYDKMSSIVNNAVSKSISGLNRIKSASDRLSKSAFATGRTYGAAGLIAASSLLIPLKAAADLERMQIALKTSFRGNQQAAQEAFSVINKFAARTPYETAEVMQGFIKLKNMGLDPGISALTAYGNTASGLGKSLNDMVEAVADATTMEFERLKEFGIRSKQEKDRVKFTFQGVTTSVAKNAKAIENYLIRVGNTKFAGGIEEQSKSLYGQLSTLKDNVTLAAAGIGNTLIPKVNELFKRIQPIIDKIGIWISKNPDLTSTIMEVAIAAVALSLSISAASFLFGGLAKAISIFSTVAIWSAKMIGGFNFALFSLRYTLVYSVWPAIVSATTAVWAFTAALLANPITWIVIAVAALGVAFYIAYQKCDKFRAIINGLIEVGKVLAKVFMGVGLVITGALTFNPSMLAQGLAQTKNAISQIAAGGIGKAFNKGYDSTMKGAKIADTQSKINSTGKTNNSIGSIGKIARENSQETFKSPVLTPNIKSSSNSQFNFTINLSGSATKADADVIGNTLEARIKKIIKQEKYNQSRVSLE